MGSANARRRYCITLYLIGWAHTQNSLWCSTPYVLIKCWIKYAQYALTEVLIYVSILNITLLKRRILRRTFNTNYWIDILCSALYCEKQWGKLTHCCNFNGGSAKSTWKMAFKIHSVWPKIPRNSKVHGANMGSTWVLSAPDGPFVGPTNLAIWVVN